jgi:hypothetical protein
MASQNKITTKKSNDKVRTADYRRVKPQNENHVRSFKRREAATQTSYSA